MSENNISNPENLLGTNNIAQFSSLASISEESKILGSIIVPKLESSELESSIPRHNFSTREPQKEETISIQIKSTGGLSTYEGELKEMMPHG